MPIIKEVPLHCQCLGKPNALLYGEGTIWECDNPKCKIRWRLVTDRTDMCKFWDKDEHYKSEPYMMFEFR